MRFARVMVIVSSLAVMTPPIQKVEAAPSPSPAPETAFDLDESDLPPAPPTQSTASPSPKPVAPQDSALGNAGVPTRTKAPPVLAAPPPSEYFRCERAYIFKGERLSCDTKLGRNGEGLRPILSEVPAALAELDRYQRNRANVEPAAYVGTLGAVIAIASFFLQGSINEATDPGNKKLAGYAAFGGLSIMGGSGVYGLVYLRQNEKHLENAVSIYNRANPGNVIQLEFSTTNWWEDWF